jgi:hypothetical protein
VLAFLTVGMKRHAVDAFFKSQFESPQLEASSLVHYLPVSNPLATPATAEE